MGNYDYLSPERVPDLEIKVVNINDFTWNEEESTFTYNKDGFVLDGDFVLLLQDEIIQNMFFAITGDNLPPDVLKYLKGIVQEIEDNRTL